MAQTLRLYSKIKPNEGRNTHYVFTSSFDYITAIDGDRVGVPLSLDNYRINGNIAKITATPTLEETMNEITYIAVYDDVTNYFRAYWVKSSALQSGYIILELEVDLWASSIKGATFSEMHVTRCNRLIDDAIYFDKLSHVNTAPTAGQWFFARLGTQAINPSYFDIVFQLNFNVSDSGFGDNQISRTALYRANIGAILSAMEAVLPEGTSYASINPLERLADALGGVYGVTTAGASPNKAQVVRAWIMFSGDIPSGYSADVPEGVVFKCHYSNRADVTFSVKGVAPAVVRYNISIEDILRTQYGYTRQQARDFQATHYLQLGTKESGLELLRGDYTRGQFKIIFSMTDVRVIVTDGVKETDITSGFEFSVTGNNATETALNRIFNCIGWELKFFAGGIEAYLSKGSIGTLLYAGKQLGGIFEMMKEAPTLSAISTGDVGTSLYVPNSTLFNPPFYFYAVSSLEDEIEHALYNGGNLDTYISNLNVGTNNFIVSTSWTFNGQSKEFARTDETFIAIDEMKLDGVQDIASEYIKGEFKRGIFYKII